MRKMRQNVWNCGSPCVECWCGTVETDWSTLDLDSHDIIVIIQLTKFSVYFYSMETEKGSEKSKYNKELRDNDGQYQKQY